MHRKVPIRRVASASGLDRHDVSGGHERSMSKVDDEQAAALEQHVDVGGGDRQVVGTDLGHELRQRGSICTRGAVEVACVSIESHGASYLIEVALRIAARLPRANAGPGHLAAFAVR
jgi:hypothetical protein